ncbi:flagellar basal body rod protein FlgB [Dyella sp. ASV21]|jgi:flagellar basal-body rod protein FlgB|uniref:flagellar basal body rod protein FlgB n=1 Tax=Dyella sp. ASV21 TaxID=2795114 RepID=UPI0018ECE6D3|nr:flagellar basal body rod protein FlgB [Dyella sp. ASV21]
MSSINDNLFGLHTQALDLWQRRSEVLASNLANADTPGYLARDVDFKKALSQASGNSEQLPMTITQQGQINPQAQAQQKLAYRVPSQPSMDGNTVDTQTEQANFAANGVHYQASLSFITAQIHMLRTAITGGQS